MTASIACDGRMLLAASLCLATCAVTFEGCSERRAADATVLPLPEASLADQAAAVRRGETVLIRLDHTNVTDDDLVLLDGLSDKLQRLNLSRTALTDEGLERICHLSRLTQLRLRGPRITATGMAHLGRLEQLRHLHLIDVPLDDAGIAELHPLTGLDSLYLDGTQATDRALSQLYKALPNVHLHVDGGHHRGVPPETDPRHEH
jgi:Leucine-rich repeat (LRR) protein